MLKKEYSYKLNNKLEDNKILEGVWNSFETGKVWRDENIIPNINKWKSAYNKDLGKNISEHRSKYVDSTVKNYNNSVVISLLEPFINTQDLVRLSSNSMNPSSIEQTKKTQSLINYQLTKKTDRFNLFEETTKLFVCEGISAQKIFWDMRIKEIIAESVLTPGEYAEYKDLTPEMLLLVTAKHKILNEIPVTGSIKEKELDDDILTSVDFIKEDIISEKPNYVNVPIENIVWDPSSSNINYINYDCDYIIEQKLVSNSELRDMLRHDSDYRGTSNKKFSDEDIEIMIKNSSEPDDNPINREPNKWNNRYWELRNTVELDNNTQVIFEYFGLMDLNQDGIDEYVHIEVMNDVVIKLELNPYYNNMIPYNIAMFDKRPFTTETDSISEVLGDIQKLRTAIMRNMVDSMAFSNVGNYIIEEGMFSQTNLKRLTEGRPGDIITAKKKGKGRLSEKIVPIHQDSIPRDFFNVYSILDTQSQENTGISKFSNGNSNSMNSTATGASISSQQSNMVLWKHTQTFIERFMKPTVNAYIIMNKMFLTNSRFIDDNNEEIYIDKTMIKEDIDMEINVAIKGLDEQKNNEKIQFLNLTAPMVEADVIPADALAEMVKSIGSGWGLKDMVKIIEDFIIKKKELEAQGMQMQQQQIIPNQQLQSQNETGFTGAQGMQGITNGVPIE